MRLHSDILRESDLHAACYDPFFVEVYGEHGSRKRERAFNCRLGAPKLPGRQYRNSGQYGRDGVYAATYHEHGWWMMTLFELDPNMVIVGALTYEGVEDFHEKTEWQFKREPQPNIEVMRENLRALSNEVKEVITA